MARSTPARPSPSALRLQWLATGLLALTIAWLPLGQLLSGLVIGLALLTLLKLLEARSRQDHRLVGLLQLLTTGMAAALRPELAPTLFQVLTVLVAFAGLAALEQEEKPGWWALLGRSTRVIAAAFPMALVLFLLVPRLQPFTRLPEDRGVGAFTGLSDSVDPGGIASLAVDQAPAARVSFPDDRPPAQGRRYWRVLVHGRFDGRRWSRREDAGSGRSAEPAPAAVDRSGSGRGGLRLWLDEASGLPAVPWGGDGRPLGAGLRVSRRGELLHRGAADRRRLYALAPAGRGSGSGSDWRRRPPEAEDLQIPPGRNPRLEALARGWAALPSPRQRLAAAEEWFRRRPFRYTLQPGRLPRQAPLDAFLFDRREGFCGHFASAFTALMRSAGVPARLVSGYRGGVWVEPLGGTAYLELRRADAHAWSEVWLEGEGWRRVDPTAWVSGGTAGQAGAGRRGGPLRWLQHQWWGLDLAWTRLWLGFDRRSQEALLRRWLGDRLEGLTLLLIVAPAAALAAGLGGLWLWQGRSGGDPWQRERDRLLGLLARRGLEPERGETLPGFAARLRHLRPDLQEDLEGFVMHYQRHRFAPPADDPGAGVRTASLDHLRRCRRRLGQRLRRSNP